MTGIPAATVVVALQCELIDRLTARISGLFEEQGIEHLLLKGPSIARWLYSDTELRAYTDADLLVPRWQWDVAVRTLVGNGFRDSLGPMDHPRMESFSSYAYRAPEGEVDLHATLHGISADWPTVWRVLSTSTETIEVGGRPIQVLGKPARLMHVAVHAGQHQSGWAIDDLRRALEQEDEHSWREAATAARRLGAEAAFASGLRVVPEGAEMAGRLGVLEAESVESKLRSAQVPLAEGLMELLATPGARAKSRLVWRELAPSPAFMRWWSPMAARSQMGLALSYAWRPVYLARHLPAAFAEVRDAKRVTRS